MPRRGAAELVLIRHAPAVHGGRLCGRTDVAADVPGDLAPWRAALGACSVVSSPARRCLETAVALFPGVDAVHDARLWEQDFGAEEGVAVSDLPDLGPLSRGALAARRPSDGESFLDMAARAVPALLDCADAGGAGAPVAVVAHAGTVRAALGHALGDPASGLAFEVAPLSLTRLRLFDGGISIACVNWQPV